MQGKRKEEEKKTFNAHDFVNPSKRREPP